MELAAVRIDDFFSHAYSGHASVSFVNSRQGWLLLQQASSAATSTGKLFETDDGGGSWSELADPPVAGRISFLSDQIGWLQGGAGKLMLFKTADGGAHWVQQSVPPANSVPNPATTNFGLPVFSDPQAGSVSVAFGTAAHNVTEAAYSTSDGGQHWVLTHEFAGIPATVSAKANVVGGNLVVAMLRGGQIQTVLSNGTSNSALLPSDVTSGYPALVAAQFVDENHGFFNVSSISCPDASKKACTWSATLLGTADGGRSVRSLQARRGSISSSLRRPSTPASPTAASLISPDLVYGSGVETYVGAYGLDACGTMDTDIVSLFWSTAASVLGFYLGGETSNVVPCTNPDGNWLYTVACKPWVYLPIWDGLQAPCAPGTTQHIDTTGLAHQQGVSAAFYGAIPTLVDEFDFPSWEVTGIAYLDIEQYPPYYQVGGSQACSQAVTDYVTGFIAEMHAWGYSAGVYASSADIFYDMSPNVIADPSNLPDSIWVPQYDQQPDTYPLGTLDQNGFVWWVNNQRAKQYDDNLPTGYPYPSLIDLDYVDGYVMGQLPYNQCQPQCTDPCNISCADYDPTDPECTDGDTEECGYDCSCFSPDGTDCCDSCDGYDYDAVPTARPAAPAIKAGQLRAPGTSNGQSGTSTTPKARPQ